MSSFYKINLPLPKDLSAKSPILISPDCSLRSAMTALEVGCRRMDSEVEGTWSVVSTATKIPFYDGSKTVTECFETILSAPVLDAPSLCDTVVGRPPISDLLPWALKVNVRVVSYLNGMHTFNESVGTIVMPSECPKASADEALADKVITLFLRAVISVVTKCRDVVWYGDVYEEEDMGMHYQREKVDSWKTEDEQLQIYRSKLGEVKEEELAETVALLDIYLYYHNYLHNLTARISNPSPCPSPLVSSVISGLIKSIDSSCCVLPPPPPRVDPTTTYVDHTTTTYSDPPYFQESLLRFVAKGQPTHACRFMSVSESLLWWAKHSKEVEGIEELWQVDAGIPGLMTRLRRHLMKDWGVTMRALCSLSLYSNNLILGRVGLHELITQDMNHLGVARVIWSDPVVDSFVQNCGRAVFEFLKVACWNPERRFQQVTTNKACMALWDKVCGDALLVDRHLSDKMSIQCGYVYSWALYYAAQYQLEAVGDGGGGVGYFSNVGWWYKEYLYSLRASVLQRFRQSKDMMRELREREWVESRRQEILKGEEGKPKKKRKSKAKLTRELEAVAYPRGPREEEDEAHWQVEFSLTLLKQNLCMGLYGLFEGLKLMGIVRRPNHEFTTDEVVFNNAVRGLEGCEHPPKKTYEEYFKEGREGGEGDKEEKAKKWIMEAKERFDVCNKVVSSVMVLVTGPSYSGSLGAVQASSVKSLAKVAIGNSIACVRALQGGEGRKVRCNTLEGFDVCTIVG